MSQWSVGAEAKYWQLSHGDNSYVNNGTPYSTSAFPVIRCFWHASPSLGSGTRVLNLSYDGRIFISSLKWEDTSQ